MGARYQSVQGDEVQEIADEVKLFSDIYDLVLTSGGLGPTHDDVTMEGIAAAFGEKLLYSKKCADLLGVSSPDDPNPLAKMAMVPTSTVVHCGPKATSIPLFVVHNVHIYVGIPSYLQETFETHKKLYSRCGVHFYRRDVYINCSETQVASLLAEVQSSFKKVHIGSYPATTLTSKYEVKISLESQCMDQLNQSFDQIKHGLPQEAIVNWTDTFNKADSLASPKSPRQSLSWLLKGKCIMCPEDLYDDITVAVDVIRSALQQYKLDEISVAFNGGKDCTVLLALYHAVLMREVGKDDRPSSINAFCISDKESFPEVDEFVEQCIHKYGLNLTTVQAPIREGLYKLKELQPSLKAVLMGTRRTDPFSQNLTSFTPTDPSWLPCMRINPILDWSYSHVWLYLRLMNIPYCSLYNKGYTSLGGIKNTLPNPSLRRVSVGEDGESDSFYQPAYLLADDAMERTGRTSKSS
ncbi:FAD synthase-like isoform X2 [Dysidea avara]|uniref:FAD synthase-like isoform X2 n=1 Tax=Dysidea avara TaxID=196820 RepID=UPI0033241BFC